MKHTLCVCLVSISMIPACSPPASTSDAGSTAGDAGAGVDAASGGNDAGPPVDTGLPPVDAATPGVDTGPDPVDAATSSGAPAAYTTLCASCHGADAQGTTLAPESRHADQSLVDYFARNGDDNQWGGTAGCEARGNCSTWGDQRTMLAFTPAQISDADLSAIGTWLRAFPHPTTGAELYADFCSNCHGPGGDIPALTYYVKNSGIIQNVPDYATFHDTVHDGLTARVPDRRDAYMPPLGTQLSDAEIHEIAVFMCGQTYSTRPGFCAGL